MSEWQYVAWFVAAPGFVLVAGVAIFYGKGATGYHWGGWRLPIAVVAAAIGFTGVVALTLLLLSGGRDPGDGWVTDPVTLTLLGVVMLAIGGASARFSRAYGNWVDARTSAHSLQRIRRFPAVFPSILFPVALVVSGIVMIETVIFL